jgi:hypothetical protein
MSIQTAYERLVRARPNLVIKEYLAHQATQGLGVAKQSDGIFRARLVFAGGKEVERAVDAFTNSMDLTDYMDGAGVKTVDGEQR